MPADYELIGIARRHLALLHDALAMDVAWMSECRGDLQVLHTIEGNPDAFALHEGIAISWPNCYSSEVAAGRLPRIIRDTKGDPRTAHHGPEHNRDVGAYAATPILLADGRVYGSLACFSRTPRPDLGPADERILTSIARSLGEEIGVYAARAAARQKRRGEIEGVIAGAGLRMVAQPIVHLATRHIVGVEALSRFDLPPQRPDKWFSDAAALGLGAPLELAAIRNALAFLPELPGDVYVSINASPATIIEPEIRELLATVDPQRVVIEVTEHSVIGDYQRVIAELAALRGTGLRIAVDDAGAGYSSFRHILNLHPDIIKLDRDMIGGVADDPARRALVAALIGFAAGLGALVVAEGIETADELECLEGLGVVLGQGYYLARPAPLPLPELRR